MLGTFLPIIPVLEHSQTQQCSLDGLTSGGRGTIWGLVCGRDLCVWDSLVRRDGAADITPTSCLGMSRQPAACPREVGSAAGSPCSVLRSRAHTEQLCRDRRAHGLPGLVILSSLLLWCTSVFLLGPAETGNKRVKITSSGFALAVILTLCGDGKGSHSLQTRETPALWMCLSEELGARF